MEKYKVKGELLFLYTKKFKIELKKYLFIEKTFILF